MYMVISFFQCDHHVSRNELTMHNIARHFLNITNRSLRIHIHNYFAKDFHRQWLRSVGRKFLLFKGLTLEEYLQYLEKPKNPLHELSLLIIAWMFRFHIAVVMRDWTWTTGHNYPVHHCTIILAFCGKLSFMLTCNIPKESSDSDNFCEEWQDSAISLSDGSVDSKIERVEKSIALKEETLKILRENNLLPPEPKVQEDCTVLETDMETIPLGK